MNTSRLTILTIGVLLSGLLYTPACERSKPKDLINEEVYVRLLAEMHLLAALYHVTEDEERHEKTRKMVLDHYKVTPGQFERSNNYYMRNLEEQERLLRKARRKLEEIDSDLADRLHELRRQNTAEP